MVTAYYPPARRNDKPAGGGTFSQIEKLVLHTTETRGLPGYPSFAPHLTYNPWDRTWYQHVPLNRSATTLADPSSTKVRENRDNAIQVEIVAYCDPKQAKDWHIDDIPDAAVRDLAEFAAWLHETAGLPLQMIRDWVAYPKSYGLRASQRLTSSQYDDFRGILGHQHVSGNDHGDPGNPPWLPQFLALAKDIAGTPAPTAPAAPVPGPIMEDENVDTEYIRIPPQPLKPGRNEVLTDLAKGFKTLATGPLKAVDLHANLDIRDATGKIVDFGTVGVHVSIVAFKDGKPTEATHNRVPDPGLRAYFGGSIKAYAKGDKKEGYSPRLRLVVEVPAGLGPLVIKDGVVQGFTLK